MSLNDGRTETGAWVDLPNPDGNQGDQGVYLDPENLISTGSGTGTGTGSGAGGSGADAATKRRGRKPGTKNKTKTALDVKNTAIGIEKLLLSLHTMAAAGLKCPELMLDVEEAKQLSMAIAAVESHYSFGMSEKGADWANLLIAIGTVYGTRAMAIKWRLDRESKNG